nr:uncharacterized protein LOC109153126 [Ipomoea trifida]
MGKKRVVKKTKELSVAIAESSSMTGDNLHQQQQQTPRKRGRPRKIVPKEEEFEEQTGKEDDVAESETKKPRISGEEESSEHKLETSGKVEASSSPSKKGDDEEASRNISQKQQARSRGRRKSKPRKSS